MHAPACAFASARSFAFAIDGIPPIRFSVTAPYYGVGERFRPIPPGTLRLAGTSCLALAHSLPRERPVNTLIGSSAIGQTKKLDWPVCPEDRTIDDRSKFIPAVSWVGIQERSTHLASFKRKPAQCTHATSGEKLISPSDAV
jgi:hypothetical protein